MADMGIKMNLDLKKTFVDAYNSATWWETPKIRKEVWENGARLTYQTSHSDSLVRSGLFIGNNVWMYFINENGVFGDTRLTIRLLDEIGKYDREIVMYGADVKIDGERLVIIEKDRINGTYGMVVVI